MKFTKMHGLGNDFVIVDGFAAALEESDYPALARAACDRHFGIGADGLILVLPSRSADFRMRIFNADGSEAEMCGNGIRCFAGYVYEQHLSRERELLIETARALNRVQLTLENGAVAAVRVDMGEPQFKRRAIPMSGDPESEAIGETIRVDGRELRVTCLSLGNPHCVTFVEDVQAVPLETLGPRIENHGAFPRRTNAEFVQVIGPTELQMRVWERGVGQTLACGSGACASLAAAARSGYCGRRATVRLPGGPLLIEWRDDNHLAMSGPAATVYAGEYDWAPERALIHA
jgi:diaminopimelate epimerase